MRKYERIAVTLDFSASDENVLNHALSQGGKSASYILLHVTETAAAIMLGKETRDYESSFDVENMEKYRINLETLGYNSQVLIGYGRPGNVLPELIRESRADLVVMGAHGHNAFKDLLFGSTIDKVRHHVSIPVLVVSHMNTPGA
jgi:manganese transport protein